MSGAANPARGEAILALGGEQLVLRPSFAALVAVEEELGPLFALVERAAAGEMSLKDMITLFWHCLIEQKSISRESLGEAVVVAGMARVTPTLKAVLHQILAGA